MFVLFAQGSPPVEYATLYEGQQTEACSWLVAEMLMNRPKTEAWRATWAMHRGSQPWVLR